MPNYKVERLKRAIATIAISTTKSNAINCLGKVLVGLIMPSAFTTLSLTFEGSINGTDFFPLRNSSGNLVTVTPVVSTLMGLASADFQMFRYLKIVAASQAAEREIICILRGM